LEGKVFAQMKKTISFALRIYKIIVPLSIFIFCVYMVVDDYMFIEKYWEVNWTEHLGLWLMYLLVFFVVLSIYYWVFSLAIIFTYHKLIKRYFQQKKK